MASENNTMETRSAAMRQREQAQQQEGNEGAQNETPAPAIPGGDENNVSVLLDALKADLDSKFESISALISKVAADVAANRNELDKTTQQLTATRVEVAFISKKTMGWSANDGREEQGQGNQQDGAARKSHENGDEPDDPDITDDTSVTTEDSSQRYHTHRPSRSNLKLTQPKLKIAEDADEVAKAYEIETFASRFSRWLNAARSMHDMSRETELQALIESLGSESRGLDEKLSRDEARNIIKDALDYAHEFKNEKVNSSVVAEASKLYKAISMRRFSSWMPLEERLRQLVAVGRISDRERVQGLLSMLERAGADVAWLKGHAVIEATLTGREPAGFPSLSDALVDFEQKIHLAADTVFDRARRTGWRSNGWRTGTNSNGSPARAKEGQGANFQDRLHALVAEHAKKIAWSPEKAERKCFRCGGAMAKCGGMRKCTAKVQGARNLKHTLQALYDEDPEAAAKEILLKLHLTDSDDSSDSESDDSGSASPDDSSDDSDN